MTEEKSGNWGFTDVGADTAETHRCFFTTTKGRRSEWCGKKRFYELPAVLPEIYIKNFKDIEEKTSLSTFLFILLCNQQKMWIYGGSVCRWTWRMSIPFSFSSSRRRIINRLPLFRVDGLHSRVFHNTLTPSQICIRLEKKSFNQETRSKVIQRSKGGERSTDFLVNVKKSVYIIQQYFVIYVSRFPRDSGRRNLVWNPIILLHHVIVTVRCTTVSNAITPKWMTKLFYFFQKLF